MATGYFALQLAIGAAAAALLLVSRFLPSLGARRLLELHYLAAALVLAVALLAPWLPPDLLSAPRTWQGAAPGHDVEFPVALPPLAEVSVDAPWLPDLATLLSASMSWCAFAGACVALWWGLDAWRLRRLCLRAQLLRRHGRVRIWVLDDARSPFSFRDFRHAHVFIPQFVVARADWYRMAVAHELQHHRQGDTAWLYLFGSLRVLGALNPFAWLWSARVERLQELACDAALLHRGRWPAAEYARSLLDVAQAAAPHRGAAWAPSLTGGPHSLKRRIEHMMEQKRTPPGVPVRVALYAGLLTALGLTAAAASSLTAQADSRVTGAGSRAPGALPVRTGAVAASFEIAEEGANKRSHSGVDIAAPAGTPVYSWQDGVVVLAGPRKGCGMAVVLQHWQGTRSLYCNLDKLRVTAGEGVGRDQSLGEVADLGARKKAHLHFEIEIDGRNVDPARQVDLLALK